MNELAAIALAAAYQQTLRRESLSDHSEGLLSSLIKNNGVGVELNDEIIVFLLHQMRIGGAGVSVVGPRGSVLIHSQCTAFELGRFQAHERSRGTTIFRFSPHTAFRAESFFALRASALAMNGRLDGDQRDVRRVYLPLNGDGHWSLLVIDCELQHIRHYDSIRIGNCAFHVNLAQRVTDMLVAAGLLLSPWPIVEQTALRQQTDAFSCGFAVIGSAAHETGYFLGNEADPLALVVMPEWIREVCVGALDQSAAGKAAWEYEHSRLRHYFRVTDGMLADAHAQRVKPAPTLAL